MKLLSDLLQMTTVYIVPVAVPEAGFANAIITLNRVLEQMTETVNRLDNVVTMLNLSVSNQPGKAHFSYDGALINQKTSANEPNGSGQYWDKPSAMQSPKSNSEHKEHDANLLEGVTKLAKGTEKLIGAFGEVPEALSSLKKVMGLVPELTEGVSGLSTMFSAAETGINASQVLTAGGAIMTGAGAVAEAGAAFGPPGWIIGLGALAAGGVATLQANSADKELTDFKDLSSDKMKAFYMDNERQKDFEKMVGYRHVSNYKQLDEIEQELDSDYMLADRRKRVDKSMEHLHMSFPDLNLEYGHRGVSGVYNYAQKRPVIEKPTSQWPQKMVRKEMTLADKITEIRHGAVIESMGGKVDYAKMNRQIAEVYKKNKAEQLLKAHEPALKKQRGWRLPTETEWDNYERAEVGLPQLPKSKNKNPIHRTAGSRPSVSQGGSVKQITINLNKPMIENFIINTKEMKEGVNDFKRKVEQVLIEILNNAN